MEYNKPLILLVSVLFIIQSTLFGLKVTNIIDWNWLWVLAPIWVPYMFCIFIGIMTVLYLLFYNIKERIFKKQNE